MNTFIVICGTVLSRTRHREWLIQLDEVPIPLSLQVMKALRDTEQHNARLHEYIEGLLVSIIDKHPELLEKR